MDFQIQQYSDIIYMINTAVSSIATRESGGGLLQSKRFALEYTRYDTMYLLEFREKVCTDVGSHLFNETNERKKRRGVYCCSLDYRCVFFRDDSPSTLPRQSSLCMITPSTHPLSRGGRAGGRGGGRGGGGGASLHRCTLVCACSAVS